MVEFAIIVPFWGMLAFGVIFVTILFTARQFLDANVYHLARAQLYGNDLSTCAPSSHWQMLEWTGGRVEFTCDRPGRARGAVYFRVASGQERILVESKVDLVSGRFERPVRPLPTLEF